MRAAWPSFRPAQIMDNGDVYKNLRPLDLGALPPWDITVTLANGGMQNIKIPYSEGAHVVGLPLGSDVPKVIASNYKTLLCMVNGMTSIITDLTLKLDRQQKVAARHLDKMSRYRVELEGWKRTVGHGMAVLQAPVSPSKKRKLSTEESGPCDTQEVCIEKPEHLPPPTSSDKPAIPALLVQESVIEEDMDESDDLPLTRAKRLRGENLPSSASLTCSNVQTEKVESVAGVVPVGESVDATMTSTSTKCQTVDSTALPISTPMEIIIPPVVESTSASGQGEDEGLKDAENLKLDDLPLSSMKRSGSENVPTSASLICSEVKTEKVESVPGALVVWEPVDATMTSTSANCQTVNCTALTNSTPADNTLPLILPTSVSSRVGDEWFEYVDNFRIPKVYADLYKKIFSKHGHMATKKVIRSNDDILLAAVISLMKIVSRMETIRGVDLGVVLLESWEGDIGDAETLQFNIEWLRKIFNTLKNSWKSSFLIDKEVESRERVLDATQVEYAGLRSRKDELETELLEVTMKIREFEGKISSEREGIQVKMAEKNTFLFEPVLGNLFNLELTN
ncbi:uncharacterized protein LOC113314339 isoform X2 [Papaver somniferum]|uniref:uncharacterized protein LOC113314339 isoform X2 n=2 Tax=Papaver somniferum TaxID=3469 RepID=UPI000E703676|nr:uncharacterized protein LOC113314339 isoform X2 [Papaver somniferum]